MLVSFEWLKELIDISVTPEKISDTLTMIGLEVEGQETIDGDVTFEVNVTPNRPDCLSVIGIAREISAVYKSPLKLPLCDIKQGLPVSDFMVEIKDPELCHRYTGRVISGVKIADSPLWLKKKLEKCGIRSINNVVDVTNYVLLEFGHPLHAFDADLLRGRKIIIAKPDTLRTGTGVEKIKTLDGIEREIPGDTLLIRDIERPVAIGGVMGGANTEVTLNTKNIFLESAWFLPSSIRRTSKRLGLSTESSYRFERGTDIIFLEKALNRAALLIQELAGGTISEIIDIYPIKYEPESFSVKYEKINNLLGISLSKTDILDILNRLGISSEDKGEYFTVTPPSNRRDIRTGCDISEEVARIYGYNNIPVTNPCTPLPPGILNKRAIYLERIRQSIRSNGFNEVINFSFSNHSHPELLMLSDSDIRRNFVSISNPLSQDECLLRTTLIPALINNLIYNLDRGMKDIRIFEISKVFINKGTTLPDEIPMFAGAYYKEKIPSLWKEDAPGFYIVKGAIETIFEEMKITNYDFSPSSEAFLHRGQSADIFIENLHIGYLGVIAPDIVEKLGLKKQKPDICLFEINLEKLFAKIPDSIQYKPIPKFPAVERDVALIVNEDLPSIKIKELISSFSTELIEKVSIFDHFKGGNIPEGRKSLAFNIVYRAKERTLTDEEVEAQHTQLVKYLIEKTGAELRK